MKRSFALATLSVVAALSFSGSVHAYATYFGEDPNSSATTPLAAIPNSSAAETSFKSGLTGVGTETFEGLATGSSAPLVLTFPGAGTATLSGGNGSVAAVTPGQTNGVGRYSIPSGTSSKFWQVTAGGSGNFTINFSTPVAALGFYGIDIGDFGGQLTLGLGGTTLTVNNTIGSGGSTDGTVLFYGLVAANSGEDFSAVTFNTTTGGGDVFAFDNFTIGVRAQICTPGTPNCGGTVPEPASLALVGLGLAGLSLSRRKSKKTKYGLHQN